MLGTDNESSKMDIQRPHQFIVCAICAVFAASFSFGHLTEVITPVIYRVHRYGECKSMVEV